MIIAAVVGVLSVAGGVVVTAAMTPNAGPPAPRVQRSSAAAPRSPHRTGTPKVMCRIDDPRLREISGLASSVNFPGVLWTHNDSGDSARVFAISARTCRIRAVVTLTGVRNRDFESMSMGRDRAGRPELWVGDTGGNLTKRRVIQVYRLSLIHI